MPYLASILVCVPAFVFAIAWGAVGAPAVWSASAGAISLLLGSMLGYRSGHKLVTALGRDGRYVPKRVPGGGWTFIVGGVLLGILCDQIIGQGGPQGMRTVHAGAVAFGTIGIASFGLIGFHVFRLERTRQMRVWMQPDGFILG